VKLYVREEGTDRLLRPTAASAKNHLTILNLSRVELRSAIRRREREGDIEPEIAAAILDRFDRHLEIKFLIQPISEVVMGQAAALIDRHRLRAYDAIQPAGCLVLRGKTGADSPIFVSADRELLAAARAEGLAVFDPAG